MNKFFTMIKDIPILSKMDFEWNTEFFRKKIIGSDFIKNVFFLMSGYFVANIISLGTAPIITRLFTPANFGLLALFGAIVATISGIGSLCYERAILLPKKNEEAINLVFLSVLILIVITITASLAMLLFKNEIIGLFGDKDLGIWYWFLPAGILLNGLLMVLRFWSIRNKRFRAVSFATAAEASVSVLTKILIGFFIGAYAGGLILGFIFGILAAFLTLLIKSSARDFKKYRLNVSRNEVKYRATLYKSFPVFASWNVLINIFSRNMVIYVFSAFFSPAIVGFYSLCASFLGRSVNLVSESVQRVYFQKAAQELSNKENMRKGFLKVTFVLMMIGFLPFLLLAIFGQTLFVIIFGESWSTSGVYIQIMAPWFFLLLISSPANVIYEVCQKQNIKLVLNIASLIMRFFSLFFGYHISKNPQVALGMFVAVNILFEMVLIIVAYSIVKRNQRSQNG